MTLASPIRETYAHNPAASGIPKIRTLIADDQLLAREVLRRMLKNEPDIEIIATPANGREAVEAIGQLKPDLVFLDVQMPELDGFGVVSEIEPSKMPAVIFVTANDGFALKAFDVQALDFLVKPCGRDRLQLALQRARARIRPPQPAESTPVSTESTRDPGPESRVSDRFVVKTGGRILFLSTTDIDWIEAADNYVHLHVGAETHRLRDTMNSIEKKLPADRFVRISRSSIVNVQRIKEMQPTLHGEYSVTLHSGVRLTLTRGYRNKLQQLGVG
jgi:two-component system LytT family response regulator